MKQKEVIVWLIGRGFVDRSVLVGWASSTLGISTQLCDSDGNGTNGKQQPSHGLVCKFQAQK